MVSLMSIHMHLTRCILCNSTVSRIKHPRNYLHIEHCRTTSLQYVYRQTNIPRYTVNTAHSAENWKTQFLHTGENYRNICLNLL